TVSVIDTATNTVVATIPVGLDPFGVAITPDGTRAYVTINGDNTVSVFDTTSNTVAATGINSRTSSRGHPAGSSPSLRDESRLRRAASGRRITSSRCCHRHTALLLPTSRLFARICRTGWQAYGNANSARKIMVSEATTRQVHGVLPHFKYIV